MKDDDQDLKRQETELETEGPEAAEDAPPYVEEERPPKRKKKRGNNPEPDYGDEAPQSGCFSRMVILFLIFFLLALLAAGIAYLEARSRLLPVAREKKKIDVVIPKGASVREIGRILEDHGVIRSAEAFRHYVALKKVGPKLKAGEMVLDASNSTPEVVAALIKGSFKLYALTIPEGLTMYQIADRAAKAGFADKKEFLSLCVDKEFIRSMGLDSETLEGYLYPETYHFSKNATTRDVVKTMVDRFWLVWDRYKTTAKTYRLSRHEIVTLASIVEKETAAPQERPLIAGVFLNRLDKKMKLETDPTVIYGIKDFDGNLTKAHLQTAHPYNTYVIEGLPPGPIANPGEESIKAVLRPAVSDYLFFVSKNDGTHYFSQTLKEHNRAVRDYQLK